MLYLPTISEKTPKTSSIVPKIQLSMTTLKRCLINKETKKSYIHQRNMDNTNDILLLMKLRFL